jgi:nucleoid DNA-binding protein
MRKCASISYSEAAACVDSVLETVAAELSKGGRVELRGFGIFTVSRAEGKKYLALDKSTRTTPAHGKILFRPSAGLKREVWKCLK